MPTDTSSSRPPSSSTPAVHPRPFLRMLRAVGRPLEQFFRIEAASGILLLVVAAVALAWANSPWGGAYEALWHSAITVEVGSVALSHPVEWIVNDCLMVIFFFVVGLEIRREIHQGELSEWRRAALPAAAALGGMIAPALLYLAIAGGVSTRSGWAVPMATDIAFAVGVLTVLGRRVPSALRVLLLALAVIDDLGAILVIALFYSKGVAPLGFLIAAGGIAAILAMQRLGVQTKALYVLPGVVVWAGVYSSGIHPTIAGVVLGLLTPIRAFRVDPAEPGAISPAESLIATLHPWVAFGVMPIFALANAGVSVGGHGADPSATTVLAAVVVALVIGKPVGVLLACWAALKTRVAVLPTGLGPRHLVALGLVAGIGFTMSLFIAQLAFASPALLASAKIGILSASAIAAVASLVVGRMLLGRAEGASS
ncbi:MAG: Na+/H+ antiporter NhaA [Polyangiaceae bacterium]|nr:Na+/H+ antiporter NhaA [Polyangiaceae bacterium]